MIRTQSKEDKDINRFLTWIKVKDSNNILLICCHVAGHLFLHFGRFSCLFNLLFILPLFVAPNIFLSYHWLPSSYSLLSPTLPSSFKSCISLSPSSACSWHCPSSYSCHAPAKGYMAHFLISSIVGHLGSQACLLESYLYPLLLPLLTAQRTTFVDLDFFFFFAFFAFNRINWKGEQTQLKVWGKEKGEKVKKSPERMCDEIGLELAL